MVGTLKGHPHVDLGYKKLKYFRESRVGTIKTFFSSRATFIFLDILAINTFDGNKRAYSINPRGGSDRLNFTFGHNTDVWFSCSLQWQNNYYVFGGYKTKGYKTKGADPRQVSMVNGNRLERKATLDFNFDSGACTVLNQITIVLCFGYGENKVCRQSNNPLGSFTKLPNSNYDHKATRIASFDGKNTIY